MNTKMTLIFALVSLCPALASAGQLYGELQTAAPFDFVVLGIMAATAFRLFGPESRRSHEVEMVIYVGFLVASFLIGALILERFHFDTGYFYMNPALLALLGALYPKKRVPRVILLGPVLMVASILSWSILTADHSPIRYRLYEGCALMDF